MARNIEIKARVANLNELVARVSPLACSGPERIFQDDTFFECSEGRLKLRKFSADAGELIFYRRANQTGPKESFYVRSPTASPESLREALTLAYGATGRVIKNRIVYMVGRTRVHLDTVQGLGTFMELEVVLQDEESAEQGEQEAQALMQQLGVALQKVSQAVQQACGADGVSVLLSNGKAAGQIIPHVHFHIVPRVTGDGLHFDATRGHCWHDGTAQFHARWPP